MHCNVLNYGYTYDAMSISYTYDAMSISALILQRLFNEHVYLQCALCHGLYGAVSTSLSC